MTFRDRRDAGVRLGQALAGYRGQDLVVLGLPRGGVPVAVEVAGALDAPLDVFVVRKLGVPGHRELAMGAIASGGVRVLNDDVVAQVPPEAVERVTEEETGELTRREAAYRGERPPLQVRDKTVVLVDDGLATGASMRAAVDAVRRLGPARVVVAVPVAPAETCERLRAEADDVVCVAAPAWFSSVGQHYDDFTEVSDREVSRLLR